MRFIATTLAAAAIAGTALFAQDTAVVVRYVRVLAADPEAVAVFYEKAFGMSETERPMNTSTFKEIMINTGATSELAQKATSTALVIATRPSGAVVSPMATVILEVPDLEKAIERVKSAGGTLMRPAARSGTFTYAIVKDPDANQIELILKR